MTLPKHITQQPKIWFTGSKEFAPQFAQKIAIDWSSCKIRISLIRREEFNHPNIKSKVQLSVIHLPLSSPLLETLNEE